MATLTPTVPSTDSAPDKLSWSADPKTLSLDIATPDAPPGAPPAAGTTSVKNTNTTSDAKLIEEISEAIVEEFDDKLSTKEGEDAMEKALEDHSVDPSMPDLDDAIDTTIEDLKSPEGIGLEIVAIDPDDQDSFKGESGETIDVDFGKRDDHMIVEGDNDVIYLVVDEDLNISETTNLTLEALTTMVEGTADQNGITLDSGFSTTFQNDWMTSVLEIVGQRFGLGSFSDQVIDRMAMITGQSVDDIIAEAIQQKHHSERQVIQAETVQRIWRD